jgi:hypothetical protein
MVQTRTRRAVRPRTGAKCIDLEAAALEGSEPAFGPYILGVRQTPGGAPMMGSRGSANGMECDAFSRRSRRMLSWRRGELRKIKGAFAKRARQISRRSIWRDHDATGPGRP